MWEIYQNSPQFRFSDPKIPFFPGFIVKNNTSTPSPSKTKFVGIYFIGLQLGLKIIHIFYVCTLCVQIFAVKFIGEIYCQIQSKYLKFLIQKNKCW